MYIEGTLWRCKKSSCRRTKSIFRDTIFENSGVSPNVIMESAYHWLNDNSHKQIMRITSLSEKTVTSLLSKFRALVSGDIQDRDSQIGGPGIVVEIDETAFGKRKYGVGRIVKETWVFGGVERTPERRMFARVVSDRSAKTLLEDISECIAPGSIVYSDGWAAYNKIKKKLKLEHGTVNHSKNFKDPETGVHTNTIEGNWGGIKVKICPSNRSQDRMQGHLNERIWKRQNEDHLWDAFIKCTKQYAVIN